MSDRKKFVKTISDKLLKLPIDKRDTPVNVINDNCSTPIGSPLNVTPASHTALTSTTASPRSYFSDDSSPRSIDNTSSPREDVIASAIPSSVKTLTNGFNASQNSDSDSNGSPRTVAYHSSLIAKMKTENPSQFIKLMKERTKCDNLSNSSKLRHVVEKPLREFKINTGSYFDFHTITPYMIVNVINEFINSNISIIINNDSIELSVIIIEDVPHINSSFINIQQLLKKLHHNMGLYRKKYIGSNMIKEKTNKLIALAEETKQLDRIEQSTIDLYMHEIPSFKILQSIVYPVYNWEKLSDLIQKQLPTIFDKEYYDNTTDLSYKIIITPNKIKTVQNREINIYDINAPSTLLLVLNVNIILKTSRLGKLINDSWTGLIQIIRFSIGDKCPYALKQKILKTLL